MAHHDYSDTAGSEPPLTPFSTRSLLSDGAHTSDEPADLGAFPSVFRALNNLHIQHQTQSQRATSLGSESESDAGEHSATWSTRIIETYLDHDDQDESGRSVSPYAPSDDEDEVGENSASSDTEGLEGEIDYPDGTIPTLGNLDSALGFLAAEQAKLIAQRDARAANHSSARESPWRHVIDPKRKRRRKRKIPITILEDQPDATAVPTREASPSSADLSSSPSKGDIAISDHDMLSSSSKVLPFKISSSSSQHLYMTSSPSSNLESRSLQSKSLDPHLLQLRALAEKLRKHFPQNESCLKNILSNDFPENNLIDPRGPEPQVGDPLTHVFIDHSNILIGFLNYVKRSRRNGSAKPLLYFPALALILERGRPIMRRVLATSSPLYQNMDMAKYLGYSVHVYIRVPDLGDSTNGPDNNDPNDTASNIHPLPVAASSSASGLRATIVKPRKPALRSATESDPGQISGVNRSSNNNTHSRSTSIPSVPLSASTSSLQTVVPPGRVRYREQGVDELLQLKLHQALVSLEADPPPPGATIVLATGDGASGQFNEDGFVGAVRTALKKGWMVELYAWTSGTSGMWKKLAEEEGKGRFKIWTIDLFAGDLLE